MWFCNMPNSLLLLACVLHELEAVVDMIPGGRCVIATSELHATALTGLREQLFGMPPGECIGVGSDPVETVLQTSNAEHSDSEGHVTCSLLYISTRVYRNNYIQPGINTKE